MTNQTILIVDDNPTNLRVLADYLQSSNFRILTARNGESAIRRSVEMQPDLILLDIMMPGIDGFEVCTLLKQEKATATIPIIFMTALHDEASKVRGFELGGVDFISKPIKHRELVARVMTHTRLQALSNKLQTLVDDKTALLNNALQREQILTMELRTALGTADALNILQQRLITTISHEFRTPLNHISQATEILGNFEDKLPGERKQRYVSHIHKAIDRLTTMLNDVLTVNHVQGGEIDWAPGASLIPQLLSDVVNNVASEDRHRITLKHQHLQEHVIIVEQAFTRIVTQLIGNACKFAPANTPIQICSWMDNQMLYLTIENVLADGVRYDEPEQLFKPFFTGDNAEFIDGIGIGLYMARRLAEWGKGQLTAQLTPTTIRLNLALPVGLSM